MTGGRYVITVGVTDGLETEEARVAVRDSVNTVWEAFEEIGYQAAEEAGGLNPSADSFREQLRSFGANRNAQDIVVLYHIGHAENVGGEHRLRMGGTSDDPHRRCIRTADIAAWLLDGTDLSSVLIILETCRAGDGVSDMTRAVSEVVRGRQKKSIAVLSASHSYELINPGCFAPLLARHLRRDAASGTATPESVALAIQQDTEKPSWQTVSHNVAFQTEEVPFFRAPEDLGVLDSGPGRALTRNERERLAIILDGLPVRPSGKDLAQIVQSADGYLHAVPAGGISDVFGYLERLDQMWTQAGRIPPILAFLEFLAARYDSSHGTKLRTLVRDVAERLGISVSMLEEMENSASSAARAPFAPVAVVLRAEHDAEREMYTLTASLFLSSTGLPDKREAELSCATAQLQQCGEQLLDQVSAWLGEIDDPGDLTVEFVSPFRLIAHPVDEWRIGVGGPAETELGTLSVVVVRPTDCRYGWKRSSAGDRWAKLAGGWTASSPEVGWLHREGASSWDRTDDIVLDGHSGREVFARLNQAKGISCIALSYPHPGPEDQQGMADGLYLALAAGIPAAIWRRDGGDAEPLRDMLDEMAKQNTLGTLPYRVRDLRNESVMADGNHLGRHLTLVWNPPDHPNRSA